MPNELKKIHMPSDLRAGQSVTATAVYVNGSGSSRTMTIQAVTEGFSATPSSVGLPAATEGEKSFMLTVTRKGTATTEMCRIEFKAFNDTIAKRPWVT